MAKKIPMMLGGTIGGDTGSSIGDEVAAASAAEVVAAAPIQVKRAAIKSAPVVSAAPSEPDEIIGSKKRSLTRGSPLTVHIQQGMDEDFRLACNIMGYSYSKVANGMLTTWVKTMRERAPDLAQMIDTVKAGKKNESVELDSLLAG